MDDEFNTRSGEVTAQFGAEEFRIVPGLAVRHLPSPKEFIKLGCRWAGSHRQP